MDMFEREKMIQEYIVRMDEGFYRKASQYDWDYMTDWSEGTLEEKYSQAASVVDREIAILEAQSFMAAIDEKTGSAVKYIEYVGDGSYKSYKLREKWPILDGSCGALVVSAPELELIGKPDLFDRDTKIAIDSCIDKGGEMVLALFGPTQNKPSHLVCVVTPLKDVSCIQKIIPWDNIQPANLMANALHNLVENVMKPDEAEDDETASPHQ